MEHQLGWTLVAIGALIVLMGFLVLAAPSIPWFGRLPGDFQFQGDGYRVHFPLASCLLLSLLLNLVLWAWQWMRSG